MASGIAAAGAAGLALTSSSGLYLRILFGIKLADYVLLAALAMAVHVVVNQKYVGHLVVVLFYLFTAFAARFGIRHHLLVYGTGPGWVYSDMNGFGPFVGAVRLVQAVLGGVGAAAGRGRARCSGCAGGTANRARPLAFARARLTAPLLRAARRGGGAGRGAGRLHLLQHQRPERVPHAVASATSAAGGVRAALQAVRGRAAAPHHPRGAADRALSQRGAPRTCAAATGW